MPNWCEGTLKLRGRPELIAQLCNECFVGTKATIYDKDDLEITSSDWCRVIGNGRAFIMDCNVGYSFDEGETEISMALPLIEAWNINSVFWAELSKKYGLDIRIHVFEKGMQFERELEVHKGHCYIDKKIEYADYVWESPMPLLGG